MKFSVSRYLIRKYAGTVSMNDGKTLLQEILITI